MTLKDKVAKWWNSPTSGTQEEDLLELSQIAEDFAIDFAEWVVKTEAFLDYGYDESLEIYKKQQNDAKGKVC